MAENNQVQDRDSGEIAIAKAKDFWSKNSKIITIIFAVLVIGGGGWLAYQNFVKKPKETEATNKSFMAEQYWRMDSLNLALNGDGKNPGLVAIAKKYSGTKAGNLASFMAGSAYIKLDQNDSAIKYLKDFDTDDKQVQARAYKLLGDAYADKGDAAKAFDSYTKAARTFEADKNGSVAALFSAAYLAQKKLNKPEDAKKLYKELQEKYPGTQESYRAQINLAMLGDYKVEY